MLKCWLESSKIIDKYTLLLEVWFSVSSILLRRFCRLRFLLPYTYLPPKYKYVYLEITPLTSGRLQQVSILTPDGKGPGLLGHHMMWLKVHPTTHTSPWRTVGSSCNINEVPPVKDVGFTLSPSRNCTLHWDRGLSELRTLVCPVQ
jgi:hypothetical protein